MRPAVCIALALMLISFSGCGGDGGGTEGAPETSTRTTDTAKSAQPGSPSVVGGIVEPDAKYPWMLRMSGCGGTLIDPQWVLTAAHCVYAGLRITKVSYTRTDPRTGAESTETFSFSQTVGPTNNRGVLIHPEYNTGAGRANDIALIKLATPVAIQPMLQTVGLPRVPLVAGVVGSLANFSHSTTLPKGSVAVFRAPMPADSGGKRFIINATTANAALCPGDSGSGIVTVEDGRATVRGVAYQATASSDCKSFDQLREADFVDVFKFRDWILQTLGKSEAQLRGNTRVRWSGFAASGRLDISCPSGSQSGPLNVAGVELAITCEAGQPQTASCQVDPNQALGTRTLVLSGITVRTTMQDGTVTVQERKARVNSMRLHGTFPPGAAWVDYTCKIGLRLPRVGTETITVSGPR